MNLAGELITPAVRAAQSAVVRYNGKGTAVYVHPSVALTVRHVGSPDKNIKWVAPGGNQQWLSKQDHQLLRAYSIGEQRRGSSDGLRAVVLHGKQTQRSDCVVNIAEQIPGIGEKVYVVTQWRIISATVRDGASFGLTPGLRLSDSLVKGDSGSALLNADGELWGVVAYIDGSGYPVAGVLDESSVVALAADLDGNGLVNMGDLSTALTAHRERTGWLARVLFAFNKSWRNN